MGKMGRKFQEMRDDYEQALLDGRIDESLTFSNWIQLEKATAKIKKNEEE
jgi:hypothetical protein|tara:strand:+ start:1421 stop:1570 length:150 start_codon:yes stop_codon:yes gene_type:complete